MCNLHCRSFPQDACAVACCLICGQEAAMAKMGLVIFHAPPLEVVLGDRDEAIPLRLALCPTSDRVQAAIKAIAVGRLPFLL